MIGSNGGNFGFDMGALLGNMMGNNNGFGNDGGIWAIILIIALCGGFNNGNGLFGNNGNAPGTTAIDASLQRGFDTQSIISKLDGINNGICNLGYDQLAQMNGISSTVTQTGNNILQSLQSLLISLMQQGFNQSTQTQSCCCKIENLLNQANYDRQADTCAITNAIAQASQNIMLNDNNNYRQLHDEQVAIQMQAKDAEISRLQGMLNNCDRDNQSNYILNRVAAMIQASSNNCCDCNPCCGRNNNLYGFA